MSDDVVAQYGLQAIQQKIQIQMDWEDLRVKALKHKAFLDEHGLDHDELMNEAKKRAWEKYKYTIKDKLPPEGFG